MIFEQLNTLIDDMIKTLHSERQAVASLDVTALDALTSQKLEQVDHLRSLMEELPKNAYEAADVRRRVARVSIEAEANAILVKDGLDVIRVLLGAGAEPGVYNARGAIAERDRQGVARSI